MRFAQPAQPSRLAILVLDGNLSQYGGKEGADLPGAVNVLRSKCNAYCMAVDPVRHARHQSSSLQPDDPFREETPLAVTNTVTSFPDRPRLDLAGVSNRDLQVHTGLRRVFDTRFGVHSICVMIPSILEEDGWDQYLGNLTLKLNAELGGIDHTAGAVISQATP